MTRYMVPKVIQDQIIFSSEFSTAWNITCLRFHRNIKKVGGGPWKLDFRLNSLRIREGWEPPGVNH